MASKRRKKNQRPKVSSRSNQIVQTKESSSQRLDRWLESLNILLGEIASVEVNTSFVDKITTEKFIPWQVYQDIYAISRANLQKSNIHLSLFDRYLRLRRQLELEYAFLIVDPKSELYDETLTKHVTQDLIILTKANSDWESLPSRLPNPLDGNNHLIMLAVHRLLNNYPFLRTLRKLGDVKNILDQHNQVLLQSKSTDIIYAQTKIQLDGEISNCYDQKLLNHPHQQTILELHREGVKAGESQWRGLIEFLITLVHTKK